MPIAPIVRKESSVVYFSGYDRSGHIGGSTCIALGSRSMEKLTTLDSHCNSLSKATADVAG